MQHNGNRLDPRPLLIFPGQGSQYRGMGSDLCADFQVARDVYDRASAALDYDMSELSFTDPNEQLNHTRYTQPAILTHSIACYEVMRDLTNDRMRPVAAAGHSLGEYSALVASGALSLEHGLQLVNRRAALMSEHGKGGMAAFPLDADTLRPIVPGFYCGIGGCNVPEQTVVGGADADLERLVEFVQEEYSVKPTVLKVEGAFHTYLMVHAAEHFRDELEATEFSARQFDVISNHTGNFHSDVPALVRAALFFQIFHPVRWMQGMQSALTRANMIIELGGGIGKREGPARKRPNLQSISKKAVQISGSTTMYVPAINSAYLVKAANLIRPTLEAQSRSADHAPAACGLGNNGNAVDENWYHLYAPFDNGVPTNASVKALTWIGELGLEDVIQVIAQAPEQNLHDLASFIGRDDAEAKPYLERMVGNQTGAVLYSVGDEVKTELIQLAERVRLRHVA
jgi:malonyl CoA-acyl carrier protein transacylase